MRENSVPAHVTRELGADVVELRIERKARHANGLLTTGYTSNCTGCPSSLGVRLAQDYTESGYIFTLLDALHEVAVQQ